MKYLLDTNVRSDARRRSAAGVADWFARPLVVDLATSAITLLEHEVGMRLMECRDSAQETALWAWRQEQVVDSFRGRVLPVDERVAGRCPALHIPDPMPEMDALITATALVHDLTLVTRNASDAKASTDKHVFRFLMRKCGRDIPLSGP